jgi:hypothetical protein
MPLTEEERKRLLEFIDKGEDMTPEEADELARLARRFFRKYGGKVENAWLMLYYAGAIRGIVYNRLTQLNPHAVHRQRRGTPAGAYGTWLAWYTTRLLTTKVNI